MLAKIKSKHKVIIWVRHAAKDKDQVSHHNSSSIIVKKKLEVMVD